MRRVTRILLAALAMGVTACGRAPDGDAAFRPIDTHTAVFWDRQTTESAELLQQITEEFNAAHAGLPVKAEHAGNYSDIFRKVTAGIRAGVLPAMAVAYENMTSEYIPTGAVLRLDPFINDPVLGLTPDELDDFFPVMLETNTFKEFGNARYSFPFAKSVLLLYFNRRVLDAAGIAEPPRTWDEFLAQCRRIRETTGKFAHAVSVDCSTVNGMIFSMGGEVIQGRKTLYDSPEAVAVFELYETLARERLAYAIPPGSFDDNIALAQGEIAFTLRSSSGLRDVGLMMEGDMTRWGVTRIPQADPERPATVLYGPNVCIFNTTPEQARAAWAFVRHFTTPEVSVRWAVGTGYLPVRRSAMEHPDMQRFLAEWPYNRAAYDSLEFARPEPNVPGWQQARDIVARGLSEILAGVKTAREAAAEITREADQALARAAGE